LYSLYDPNSYVSKHGIPAEHFYADIHCYWADQRIGLNELTDEDLSARSACTPDAASKTDGQQARTSYLMGFSLRSMPEDRIDSESLSGPGAEQLITGGMILSSSRQRKRSASLLSFVHQVPDTEPERSPKNGEDSHYGQGADQGVMVRRSGPKPGCNKTVNERKMRLETLDLIDGLLVSHTSWEKGCLRTKKG
jgi:hypothetical protein